MNNQTIDFSSAGFAAGPIPSFPFTLDMADTASWFVVGLSVEGQLFTITPGADADLFFSSNNPLNLFGSFSGMDLLGSGQVDLSASSVAGIQIEGHRIEPQIGVSEPQDGGLLLLGILAAIAIYVWTRKRSG